MIKDLCFEVIQKCPNECKFCSSNSSIEKNTVISLYDFKRTIDYFIEQGGIQELSISGGEPFLHPDIFEMVKFCKEKRIRTVIFTSGIKRATPLTDEEKKYIKEQCEHDIQEIEEHEPWNERLKRNVKAYYNRMANPPEFGSLTRQELCRLKQLGLDKIVFDYQAFEEETDRYLMGRNNLNTSLIGSLIRARQAGLDVDVHFIPMKPNYKQFGDILECLEIAQIPNISILNFVPQGRGKQNQEDLMLSKQEMQEFSRILDEEGKKYSGNIRIGIPLLGNIKHLCTAGTEKLDIKYDGTILPCPAFKEISKEKLEKYGIKIYSIYDLDGFVPKAGTREKPLCKQIYKFNSSLAGNGEGR